ncbi:MAG: acyl-CoA dehydrogenase family protein [Mycobacterium sp.]
MDLTYTEDQLAYRDAVRSFSDQVLRPIDAEFNFDRHLSAADIHEIRDRLAKYEIATTAPTTSDGSLDLVATGIFMEEISRVSLGFAGLMSSLFFPISSLAGLLTDDQRVTYGKFFDRGAGVALAISESAAGSNPREIKASAELQGDSWVLRGRKMWASDADIADLIIVAACEVQSGEIGLFMVPGGTANCDVTPIDMLGMRAVSECEIAFDDCRIPEDARLRLPDGFASALALLWNGRVRVSFMAVGVAQAALDLAVAHAKSRTQFGRPIAGFQLVQGLLADMAIEVEAMRLLAFRAACLVSSGSPEAQVAVSMAKAFNAEAAVRVTSRGIQVHGAMGLATECPAERYFRDARMLTIPDGTTQIHQLIIGRSLTGISALR